MPTLKQHAGSPGYGYLKERCLVKNVSLTGKGALRYFFMDGLLLSSCAGAHYFPGSANRAGKDLEKYMEAFLEKHYKLPGGNTDASFRYYVEIHQGRKTDTLSYHWVLNRDKDSLFLKELVLCLHSMKVKMLNHDTLCYSIWISTLGKCRLEIKYRGKKASTGYK